MTPDQGAGVSLASAPAVKLAGGIPSHCIGVRAWSRRWSPGRHVVLAQGGRYGQVRLFRTVLGAPGAAADHMTPFSAGLTCGRGVPAAGGGVGWA